MLDERADHLIGEFEGPLIEPETGDPNTLAEAVGLFQLVRPGTVVAAQKIVSADTQRPCDPHDRLPLAFRKDFHVRLGLLNGMPDVAVKAAARPRNPVKAI